MGDAVSDTVFDESYLLADIGDTINVDTELNKVVLLSSEGACPSNSGGSPATCSILGRQLARASSIKEPS